MLIHIYIKRYKKSPMIKDFCISQPKQFFPIKNIAKTLPTLPKMNFVLNRIQNASLKDNNNKFILTYRVSAQFKA